jgi:hypothetical protein
MINYFIYRFNQMNPLIAGHLRIISKHGYIQVESIMSIKFIKGQGFYTLLTRVGN